MTSKLDRHLELLFRMTSPAKTHGDIVCPAWTQLACIEFAVGRNYQPVAAASETIYYKAVFYDAVVSGTGKYSDSDRSNRSTLTA